MRDCDPECSAGAGLHDPHGCETVESTPTFYGLAVFDGWERLADTAGKVVRLADAGRPPSILGLRDRFDASSGAPLPADLLRPPAVDLSSGRILSFRHEPGLICCTTSDLEARLQQLAHGGAGTLAEAFGAWMLPRLALRLQSEVREGKLLLCSPISSPEHERRVCDVLLGSQPDRVEVHDLAPLGRTRALQRPDIPQA